MVDSIEETKKTQRALELIEKILPHLPDYGKFHFAYFAQDVLQFNSQEVIELVSHRHIIKNLMKNQFFYIHEITADYYYELTEIGRNAKGKGGHKKYQLYLLDKTRTEKQKEEIDFKIKKWTYKARYIPFILSALALAISIISLSC